MAAHFKQGRHPVATGGERLVSGTESSLRECYKVSDCPERYKLEGYIRKSLNPRQTVLYSIIILEKSMAILHLILYYSTIPYNIVKQNVSTR